MAKKDQKHGIPVVFSFFIPGLGQLIKGHLGKAIGFFLGSLIGLFLLVIPGVLIWLWNLYDAYNSNESGE